MSMLAMLASQALYVTGREPPAALRSFVSSIRSVLPSVVEDRILGPELGKLAGWFTRQAFD
jgi:histidine ammonia-lyase